MCDYSLHEQVTRLAADGDRLVVHRFQGGTIGLAPADDPAFAPKCEQARRNWLARFWEYIRPASDSIPAVCVPPGAQLVLHGIPVHLQRHLKVGETEHVIFTQLSMDPYVHRDAIRFPNGEQISLQELHPGQLVTVISTTGAEPEVTSPEEHTVMPDTAVPVGSRD